MPTFTSLIALNQQTGQLIKNAAGSVYDPADTSFSTPLSVTTPDGLSVTDVRVLPQGILEQFDTGTGGLLVVVWKSGGLPAIRVTSYEENVSAARAARDAAQAAQGAAEEAAAAAKAPTQDAVRDVVDADLAANAGVADSLDVRYWRETQADSALGADRAGRPLINTALGWVAVNAVGDGITDDTAALQADALSARAIPGTPLELRPGATYLISDGINMTGLTVRMNGATIVSAGGGIAAPNLLTTTGDLTLIGPGVLDGNITGTVNPGTSAAGNAVYAAQAAVGSQITIRDITIRDCWQRGISIATDQPAPTDALNAFDLPVFIEGVTVTGCNAYGIFVSEIARPVIRNCTANDNQNGIFAQLGWGVVMSGCTTNNNGAHGHVLLYCRGASVSGFTADNNGQSGVAFGGGSTTNTPNVRGSIGPGSCTGNTQNGVSVDPTISGQGGMPVFWGGSISGVTAAENGIHGINLTAVADAAISGSTCIANVGSGIGVSGTRVAVGDNACRNNGTYGIALFGNAIDNPDYGDHALGVNILTGNTTAPITNTAPVASVQATTEPVPAG